MGMQMLKIKAHPEVYEELENSRTWYDEKATKLGVDFLKEVDNAIERIRESPEAWSWYEKKIGVRKFLVHRFPYAVIYRYNENMIYILAVANLRRKPGYWKHRIRDGMKRDKK